MVSNLASDPPRVGEKCTDTRQQYSAAKEEEDAAAAATPETRLMDSITKSTPRTAPVSLHMAARPRDTSRSLFL